MAKSEVPQWLLERYILGELNREKKEEIELLIKKNPQLNSKIDDLKKSNQAILQNYPVDLITKQIKEKLSIAKTGKGARSSSVFKRIFYLSPILATAVILVVVGFNFIKQPHTDDPNGSTRSKGISPINLHQPHLLVHRKKGDFIELLKNGSIARQGDLLQLAYIPAQKTFGMIFSIDGKGMVTLHFPGHEKGSTLLQAKKKTYLSTAYQLDDAPNFERFFFITADAPINVKEILKQARNFSKDLHLARQESLNLSSKYEQHSILINKGDNK